MSLGATNAIAGQIGDEHIELAIGSGPQRGSEALLQLVGRQPSL